MASLWNSFWIHISNFSLSGIGGIMGRYSKIKLDVPYYKQPGEYECSPTSVRMIAEFYGLEGPDLEFYMDICKTKTTGTYSHNYLAALRNIGLEMRKISSTRAIHKALNEGHPVLVSFRTSGICSHTSVIVGHDPDKHLLYFNDPYYGKNFTMPQGILRMVQHAAYRLKIT